MFANSQVGYGKSPVRAELATTPGKDKPTGFRVFYGDWAVVAWLETDDSVHVESRELAERDDLPASAEVIASCTRRLSVWSDEDREFNWTDQFESYTTRLRKRFGVFIRDNVKASGGYKA